MAAVHVNQAGFTHVTEIRYKANGVGLLATAAAAHPDPVTGFVCVRL